VATVNLARRKIAASATMKAHYDIPGNQRVWNLFVVTAHFRPLANCRS
jgi:hypothetical protein